jgi:hypothetical protein
MPFSIRLDGRGSSLHGKSGNMEIHRIRCHACGAGTYYVQMDLYTRLLEQEEMRVTCLKELAATGEGEVLLLALSESAAVWDFENAGGRVFFPGGCAPSFSCN